MTDWSPGGYLDSSNPYHEDYVEPKPRQPKQPTSRLTTALGILFWGVVAVAEGRYFLSQEPRNPKNTAVEESPLRKIRKPIETRQSYRDLQKKSIENAIASRPASE